MANLSCFPYALGRPAAAFTLPRRCSLKRRRSCLTGTARLRQYRSCFLLPPSQQFSRALHTAKILRDAVTKTWSSNIYTRLNSDPLEIRLLEIVPTPAPGDTDSDIICHLRTFELSEAPPYRCLSYVWGVSDPCPIHIVHESTSASEKIHVTKNLFGFLQRMRERSDDLGPQTEYLWIDALCVNQDDMGEKAAQVPEMGAIYARAEGVIAWLGWEDDLRGNGVRNAQNQNAEADVADAMQYIRDINVRYRAWLECTKTDHLQEMRAFSFGDPRMYQALGLDYPTASTWAALGALLDRAWFSRTWIAQEAVLARSMIFVCGSQVVSREEVVEMVLFLYHSGLLFILALNNSDAEERFTRMPGYSTLLFAALWQDCYRTPMDVHGFGILQGLDLDNVRIGDALEVLLRQTRSFGASEPRDKVFAPLALLRQMTKSATKNRLDLELDYTSSITDVYSKTAAYILKGSSDLALLSLVEDESLRAESTLPREALQRMPSWVPDFTTTLFHPFGDKFVAKYSPLKDRQPRCTVGQDGKILQLEGFLLGSVSKLATNLTDMFLSFDLRELVEFCLRLDMVYHNGEDRTEALWRNLVVNRNGLVYPAPTTLGSSFKHMLSVWTAYHLYGNADEPKNAQAQIQWEKWSCFDRLHMSSPSAAATIPSLEELRTFCVKWRTIVFSEDGEEKTNRFNEMCTQHMQYSQSAAHVYNSRRLFTTRSGYLCVGPASTQLNDQIWVVSGGVTPLVLRPLDSGVGQYFKLVGEVYVHGMMDGEILDQKREDDFQKLLIK